MTKDKDKDTTELEREQEKERRLNKIEFILDGKKLSFSPPFSSPFFVWDLKVKLFEHMELDPLYAPHSLSFSQVLFLFHFVNSFNFLNFV